MEQAKGGTASTVNVPADLWNYGKRELVAGQLTIETSAATFVDKGEDRHCVLYGNKQMAECQRDVREVPQMVAYLAVFDGHDGEQAADYCWKGLLPHILSETQESVRSGQAIVVDGCRVESPLDAGIITAFQRAEDRFGMKLPPPTFDNVKQGVNATRCDNKGFLARTFRSRPRKPKRGGTTALTLQIYSEYQEELGATTEQSRPMHYAVVTNLGDCRLVTDRGTGSHEYHQVTTDHRPGESGEQARLEKHVRKGDAVVGRLASPGAALRVFPGGLAVSRSIGDLECSRAVIPTPDIFRVPITGETRTHRFVMACDGLWDVLSNTEVGRIVARSQPNYETAKGESSDYDANGEKERETSDTSSTKGASTAHEMIVSPNEAAARLMKRCLQEGGYMDDVTILVVDITYDGNVEPENKTLAN